METLNKIKAKLAIWKCNHLSQAGRLVLVKSVSTSIPLHTLSVTWLQDSFLHKIQTLINNLLWQNNPQTKGLHLINWNTVTSHKDQGGLNIQDITFFRITLQATRIQRYLNDDGSLWSTILYTKYGNVHLWNIPKYHQSSWSLKQFTRAMNDLKEFFLYK